MIWTGQYWGWWSWWGAESQNCGCGCLPQVKLSGYPVQAVSEVKINGDILAPTEYRLDESRYVTRLNDAMWPVCQNLVPGTTTRKARSPSPTPTGKTRPALGVSAAAQLACELYKECAGGAAGTCALPKGTTRVTRQGITVERLAFTSWGYTGRGTRGGRMSGWQTGLPLVDAFLNTYNRTGLLATADVLGSGETLRTAVDRHDRRAQRTRYLGVFSSVRSWSVRCRGEVRSFFGRPRSNAGFASPADAPDLGIRSGDLTANLRFEVRPGEEGQEAIVGTNATHRGFNYPAFWDLNGRPWLFSALQQFFPDARRT